MPDREVAVHEVAPLAVPAGEGAHVERVVEHGGAVVDAAFGAVAAERGAHLLAHLELPFAHGLAVVGVFRVMADARQDGACHVHVEEAVQSEVLLVGDVLVHVLLAAHFPAAAIDLSAGVNRVFQGVAVAVLRHVVDVPALGVAVEVVLVDVAVHAVAERLAVGDGVAHAFLAAEAVVGGEEVREGTVVPAFLEADHAHLGLVDADFLEAAHDVLEVLEGVLHQDGRHGFQPVLPRGLRAVAASELAPHEEGLCGVGEGLVALDALAERLHFASVELPLAVEASHAGVRGVGAV